MLAEYEFGIASLLNKKEGDMVNFQDSQIENFALDVKSNKQKLRSHVEVVKSGRQKWLSKVVVKSGRQMWSYNGAVK